MGATGATGEQGPGGDSAPIPKSNVVGSIEFGGRGDVEGESQDGGSSLDGPYNVYAWSFAGSQTTSIGSGSSGAGAGKATLTDVSFTTNVSTASESLFADLLQGATNAAAILTVQLPNGDSIEYRFTNIEVDSVNQSDDGSSATPNPLMDVKLTVGSVVVDSSPESGGSTPSPIPPGWSQVTKTQTG